MSLIECVPNFSEGRRADVVSRIVDAIGRSSDAHILDVSSDSSHNRSVLTLAGHEDGLERAVLTLFDHVVRDVNLQSQTGVHPRIGAVDVVPFVPLLDTSMAAAVALARRVGARVAERFGIPVYLYEAAAADPDRKRLEALRRGGLTGLVQRGWAPDFGPATPHPTAGVSVVGARKLLVAFNVNLASDDLAIAKHIAAAVRESNGGLPALKALGLRLAERGIVQVSMNLTDYEQTPIPRAFAAVSREASRLGVTIVESEIIGLIPAAALAGSSPEELGLGKDVTAKLLEPHLSALAEGR